MSSNVDVCPACKGPTEWHCSGQVGLVYCQHSKKATQVAYDPVICEWTGFCIRNPDDTVRMVVFADIEILGTIYKSNPHMARAVQRQVA